MTIKIVIVGGGSAGWLTAGILAAEYLSDDSCSITLVESPEINTVGVGEGTWPTMRTTLQKIGISETDFIRSCSASFKQGSKFVGWNGEGKDSYYHPFSPPLGNDPHGAFHAWQALRQNVNYSKAVCPQVAACDLFKAPKQPATPEYAGVLNYGYHLDAGAFGALLRDHCVNALKVEHVQGTVQHVENDDAGYIESLKLACGQSLAGDLFIDCSGAKSLLLAEHCGVGFRDLSSTSINDRAIAVHVPYDNGFQNIESATVATAQESGWTWDIGLSSRRGVGYVYSSQFCSEERAEETLRHYIAQSAKVSQSELSPRVIPIIPGYREKHWHKNCVAVGMAAGFIEPLEASALALVELSANMIRDELPRCRASMEIVERRFNSIFRYRWEKIEEFLKLHYVISSRRDSPYWREVTRLDTCPDGLLEFLQLWKQRPPNLYDFMQTEELFPAISYQYVLYGMGFDTQSNNSRRRDFSITNASEYFNKVDADTKKIAQHLPTNRKLIDSLSSNAFPKI